MVATFSYQSPHHENKLVGLGSDQYDSSVYFSFLSLYPLHVVLLKPADSKRSARRAGTRTIILPVVKYHPSITTHTSHQGRGPSPAQKTFPARKREQKQVQRPDQKPDQRPDQKLDQKPANFVLEDISDVLERPVLNYGSEGKIGRNPVGGRNGQNSLKTLSSGPSPGKSILEGGELTVSFVEKVEVLTRGQRENPAWFDWRKNRITASNVHQIAHSGFVNGTSSTLPASYLANITGRPHLLPVVTDR